MRYALYALAVVSIAWALLGYYGSIALDWGLVPVVVSSLLIIQAIIFVITVRRLS